MISYRQTLKKKVMGNQAQAPGNGAKKLTYDELNKAASELHIQYQKLAAEYQKVVAQLQSRDFDYTSFFLQMLFKVLEHPELYKDEFVKWCVENIQGALTTFANSLKPEAEPESVTKPDQKSQGAANEA